MEDQFSLNQLAQEIAKEGNKTTDEAIQQKLAQNGYHPNGVFESLANLVEEYGVRIIY